MKADENIYKLIDQQDNYKMAIKDFWFGVLTCPYRKYFCNVPTVIG